MDLFIRQLPALGLVGILLISSTQFEPTPKLNRKPRHNRRIGK